MDFYSAFITQLISENNFNQKTGTDFNFIVSKHCMSNGLKQN